jgi:hypothetical protein
MRRLPLLASALGVFTACANAPAPPPTSHTEVITLTASANGLSFSEAIDSGPSRTICAGEGSACTIEVRKGDRLVLRFMSDLPWPVPPRLQDARVINTRGAARASAHEVVARYDVVGVGETSLAGCQPCKAPLCACAAYDLRLVASY